MEEGRREGEKTPELMSHRPTSPLDVATTRGNQRSYLYTIEKRGERGEERYMYIEERERGVERERRERQK